MVDNTWDSREFPLLVRAYEIEEANGERDLIGSLASDELNGEELVRTALRLRDARFISAAVDPMGHGQPPLVRDWGLTERGLRAVGAWPNPEDAGERFLAELQRAIDSAPDDAERTKLEKVKAAMAEIGKASISTVVAAALKAAAGLP